GFGDSSNRLEPSRRLRKLHSYEPHDQRAKRSSDKQPTPSVDAERCQRDENASEQSSSGNADESERVRPRGITSSEARGQQLTQVGIDQRQLGADTDARKK